MELKWFEFQKDDPRRQPGEHFESICLKCLVTEDEMRSKIAAIGVSI